MDPRFLEYSRAMAKVAMQSAWEDINPRVSGGKRKQKDKKTLLVDVENEELEEANVVGRNPGTIPIEMEVEPVEATPQCGG